MITPDTCALLGACMRWESVERRVRRGPSDHVPKVSMSPARTCSRRTHVLFGRVYVRWELV